MSSYDEFWERGSEESLEVFKFLFIVVEKWEGFQVSKFLLFDLFIGLFTAHFFNTANINQRTNYFCSLFIVWLLEVWSSKTWPDFKLILDINADPCFDVY